MRSWEVSSPKVNSALLQNDYRYLSVKLLGHMTSILAIFEQLWIFHFLLNIPLLKLSVLTWLCFLDLVFYDCAVKVSVLLWSILLPPKFLPGRDSFPSFLPHGADFSASFPVPPVSQRPKYLRRRQWSKLTPKSSQNAAATAHFHRLWCTGKGSWGFYVTDWEERGSFSTLS
jgi:hypothetical protein